MSTLLDVPEVRHVFPRPWLNLVLLGTILLLSRGVTASESLEQFSRASLPGNLVLFSMFLGILTRSTLRGLVACLVASKTRL